MPVTPTTIPTVTPMLRVVGVISVFEVVCVMIPDEKDEKIILSNAISESLKVFV